MPHVYVCVYVYDCAVRRGKRVNRRGRCDTCTVFSRTLPQVIADEMDAMSMPCARDVSS